MLSSSRGCGQDLGWSLWGWSFTLKLGAIQSKDERYE